MCLLGNCFYNIFCYYIIPAPFNYAFLNALNKSAAILILSSVFFLLNPVFIKEIKYSKLYHLRKLNFWKLYFSWWTIAKASWISEGCVLVSNNLLRKIVSPLDSTTALDERFKNTLVSVFILDFNLPSCELGNFRLSVILIHFILIFYLTVSCEKYKLVSLTSSIMCFLVGLHFL